MKIIRKSLKKMNSLLLIAALMIGALAFSGCSRNNDPDTIVIWAFPYYDIAIREAIRIYQETNPDVQFEVVALGHEDLVQKLRIALATGNRDILPNIVVDEYYRIRALIEFYGDFFVDLTPYVDPSLYVDFTIQNVTIDGRIWAVPYDTGVGAWFYRLDVIEAAGFTEADLQNITWDRLIEIGEVVMEKTGFYILPLFIEENIEGRLMLHSANAWYYDLYGNLDIENNQAIIDTTETLKRLATSGVFFEVSDFGDIIGSFYNNITAGVIGGAWWSFIIAENEEHFGLWRVAPPPRLTGGARYSHFTNVASCAWLVINRDNHEIATDFLMSTIAVDTTISDIMARSHTVVPALIAGGTVEYAKAGHPFFGYQPLVALMAEWSLHIPIVNFGLHSYEINYAHGLLIREFINGAITIDELMTTLQQQAEIIEGR